MSPSSNSYTITHCSPSYVYYLLNPVLNYCLVNTVHDPACYYTY